MRKYVAAGLVVLGIAGAGGYALAQSQEEVQRLKDQIEQSDAAKKQISINVANAYLAIPNKRAETAALLARAFLDVSESKAKSKDLGTEPRMPLDTDFHLQALQVSQNQRIIELLEQIAKQTAPKGK